MVSEGNTFNLFLSLMGIKNCFQRVFRLTKIISLQKRTKMKLLTNPKPNPNLHVIKKDKTKLMPKINTMVIIFEGRLKSHKNSTRFYGSNDILAEGTTLK